MVVVSVVEASYSSMGLYEGQKCFFVPVTHRKRQNMAITFVDTEYADLIRCTPAALAVSPAAEQGLIALNLTFKVGLLKLYQRCFIDEASKLMKGSLYGREIERDTEPKPIRRDTKAKELNQARNVYSCCPEYVTMRSEVFPAPAAPVRAITKTPNTFAKPAYRTADPRHILSIANRTNPLGTVITERNRCLVVGYYLL